MSPLAGPKNNPVKLQDSTFELYKDCHLPEVISFSVFSRAIDGISIYKPQRAILTIVDFTLPSSQKRFFVIDLNARKLLVSTLVAHGKNSGLNLADQFSNKMESYQSSPGFYKVGIPLQSPKHGPALQLLGLEKGINDNAQKRHIIIHGAKYVSQDFIQRYGRCGRSFGCPALPLSEIPKVIPLLSSGSLLYIHVSKNEEKRLPDIANNARYADVGTSKMQFPYLDVVLHSAFVQYFQRK